MVNKGDRPGVENTEKALKTMLELAHPTERVFKHHGTYMNVSVPKANANSKMWIPPIQRTVSTEGMGIVELTDAIARHVEHLRLSGDWAIRERTRLEVELEALIREGLMTKFREQLTAEAYEKVIEAVVERKVSPWEAASQLLKGNSK